jgi:hypothetical protein
MAKFRRQCKIIAQVYSSLIIRFNGDGTLISSGNSFLALSCSVEQERGKDLNKESKFHCQKTRAGKKYLFVFWKKMRIIISNLDICKKSNLKSCKEERDKNAG